MNTNQLFRVLLPGILIFSGTSGYSQSNPVTEKLIDIGYHKLFISSSGPKNARFTVIFESGAGGTSNDWKRVRALLSADIQILAYDRAGLGKSEAGPLPRTMNQEVFELHKLLKVAKINGPIILVGQSMGGLNVRLFTEKYRKNVAGVVLVDPAHESMFLGSFKYGGWVRLREKAKGKVIPEPQLKQKESSGYDTEAEYMAEEFQKMYLSGINNPQQLMHWPLIILGAGIRPQPPGTPDEQWKELRKERDDQVQSLTNLSDNSKFILVEKSMHAIHYDNPEIVAKAIEMVINSINTKTKL